MSKLEELFYDEEKEFEKLVPKVKKILRIRKGDCKISIVCDKQRLSKKELIACYLIGKFFAKKLGCTDKETANATEIAAELNIEKSVVNARLADLKKENIAETVNRGKYKISTINLESFIDRILKKLGENNGK